MVWIYIFTYVLHDNHKSTNMLPKDMYHSHKIIAIILDLIEDISLVREDPIKLVNISFATT